MPYKNHPSVIRITQKMAGCEVFDFSPVTKHDIRDTILHLDDKKAIQENSIPTKLLN